MAGEPLVTIAAFAPQLQVISSKQRPRKLTIYGSNGAEYMFLLKVGGGAGGRGLKQGALWRERKSSQAAVAIMHRVQHPRPCQTLDPLPCPPTCVRRVMRTCVRTSA